MHDKRSATVSTRVSPELELASRTLAAADGRTLSDLIEHLLSDYVASKRKAYLELLRTDARRVDQLPGWASRAFLRLRHADELEGASRMLGEWARESGSE